MVETIIVAVFVIGICTFLFANFLPLIGDYERVSNYDTVEAKYKIHEIRKMILRDPDGSNIFASITDENAMNVYSPSNLCNKLKSTSHCISFLGTNFLDVKDIYVTSFKLTKMKNTIKSLKGERSIKEYIDYLPSYSKYSSAYDDYYRLIVVFNDGVMANIEVII